jgi:chromosome segregation ATPase
MRTMISLFLQLESTMEQARATEKRLQEQLQVCMSNGGESSKAAASLQTALDKAQSDSKKLQQQLQESGKSLSDCSKEAAALRLQLQQLQAQLLHMQSQHASELADRAAAAESAAAAASAELSASAAKLQALQEELTRVGSRLDDAESSRYRTESKLRALEEEKSRAGAILCEEPCAALQDVTLFAEARARLEAETVQVAAAKAKLQAQDAEAALQRSLAQLNSAGAEANFIRNEKERLARDMASLLERCQSSEAARTESQRLLKAAEKEKDRVSEMFAAAEADLLQSNKEVAALKQRLDSENNDSKAAMLEKQRSQMRQTIVRLKSATESMEGALTCLHCMQLLSCAVVAIEDGGVHCQKCHEAEALGPFVHCDAVDQLAAKFGHQRQLLQDIMM